MSKGIRIGVAGVALAAAGIGGAVVGGNDVASHHSSSATLTASTTAATTPPAMAPATKAGHKHRARNLASRALHGTVVVERKGTPTTLDLQRGQVTSVNATTLVVKSKDGFEATYALTPQTKVRKDKAKADTAAITPGSTVGVVALASPNGGNPAAQGVRVKG